MIELNNLKTILKILGVTSLAIGFAACKSGDNGSGSGSSLEIPQMAGPVSGGTGTAVIPQATGTAITGSTTPANSQAAAFKSLVKSFLDFSKVTDQFSCFAKTLVNNGVVQGDGTSVVFYDDQDSSAYKAKFSVTANGTELVNYKMYLCSSGASTNSFYVTAAKSGNNISFTMKYKYSTSVEGSMTVTGQVNGGDWLNKVVEMQNVASNNIYKFQMTQTSSTMTLKSASDAASGTDYLMYGKFGVSGSGADSYAMTEGTAKYYINGTGSELVSHWNSTGANASTSAYAADVSAASYYSLPLSFSGAIGGDEIWDCSNGSTQTVSSSSLSASVKSQLEACSSN
tara:strand:- start:80089 stop:81114 length:1026 start_codon:yes stop_codon:yes gene_type:complete